MEEIKVGEYVRNKFGTIGKVTRIEEGKFLYDGKELITFIGNVVKHSPNLIDLIEEGDFVNNRQVLQVFIDPFTKKKRLLIEGTKVNWQGDMSAVYCEAENIKSVITKEMMESIKYEV